MGTLDSRNDTLHTGQLVSSIDSLIIFDGKHMTTATGSQVGMHWSDAWIIQTCTDGEGFFYLSVFGLHHEGTRTMNDTFCTAVHGSSRIVGIDTMTGSLSQVNLHTLVIDIVIDGTRSIASATHTSDKIVRIITANLLFQLPFQFL